MFEFPICLPLKGLVHISLFSLIFFISYCLSFVYVIWHTYTHAQKCYWLVITRLFFAINTSLNILANKISQTLINSWKLYLDSHALFRNERLVVCELSGSNFCLLSYVFIYFFMDWERIFATSLFLLLESETNSRYSGQHEYTSKQIIKKYIWEQIFEQHMRHWEWEKRTRDPKKNVIHTHRFLLNFMARNGVTSSPIKQTSYQCWILRIYVWYKPRVQGETQAQTPMINASYIETNIWTTYLGTDVWITIESNT